MSEVQDRLFSCLKCLRMELTEADMLRMQVKALHRVLSQEEVDAMAEKTDRAALMRQMDAVCRFILEVVNPAGIGEGVDDLLASVADEMDGLGEFPNLRALRRLLEAGGETGAVGDVTSRLLERLTLCEHDSSPNCSARAPYTRDAIEFRRGSGGSPNAARHFISNQMEGEVTA